MAWDPIVLRDDDYTVKRAVLVPKDTAQAAARRVDLVNGDRVVATDDFLAQPGVVDITEELRAVASEI
jgi:hypothetical protein